MSKQYFVTSTGTEIGKSYYLQKLISNYQKQHKEINVIKPIISGFEFSDQNNDSALILKALGNIYNIENLDKISPWRFKEPLSPNIAAKYENKEIKFNDVVTFCEHNINLSNNTNIDLAIEGAGGIMTPINNKFTYLDLLKELKIPAILVIGNYLGTISHSLTAIKCLTDYNIEIDRIILNCLDKSIDYKVNLENLKLFTKANIELIK